MFFKVTETCTIDTSEVYVKGEEEVNVFQARNHDELKAYFEELDEYNTTNGLDITIEEITEDEANALIEGFIAIDIDEFAK